MSTTDTIGADSGFDHDVVIVGGKAPDDEREQRAVEPPKSALSAGGPLRTRWCFTSHGQSFTAFDCRSVSILA